MSASDAAGVMLALLVLFAVVAASISHAIGNVRTPQGICRQLRRRGGRITISSTGVMGNLGIWNPSMHGREMFLYQRGVATYWLDDDEQVHLDWKSSKGHQQFVGPMLPQVDHRAENRIALWTVLVVGGGGLVIGFLFSLVGEVGSHPDKRVVFAVVGFGIALTILVLVERTAVRRHKRAKLT